MVYVSGNIQVSFNTEWVASKKLPEFIKHESHHGLTREQLKEIHGLCKAKHKDSSFSVTKDES